MLDEFDTKAYQSAITVKIMPVTNSARMAVKTAFREREGNLKSFRITNVPMTSITKSQPTGPTANTAVEKTGKCPIPISDNSDRNLGMTRKTVKPHRKYAPANIRV